MPDDDEFLQTLRATFRIEADEHIQEIATGLLALEKEGASNEERRQVVERVFRAAHSLKGAARAVNFSQIETICQSMEDIFAAWKRQEGSPSRAVLDSLHRSLDAASRSLAGDEGTAVVLPPPPSVEVRLPIPVAPNIAAAPEPEPVDFRGTREGVPAGSVPVPATPAAPVVAGTETVRISVSKLDARLLEAEELLIAKLTTRQRAADLEGLAAQFEEWRQEWSKVQSDVRTLRQRMERNSGGDSASLSGLSRVVDFFDWSHDYLRTVESKVSGLRHTAEQDHLVIGKLVDDLLEDSKKLLMLPLATLGSMLPKIVRDLCRDQGKEADLVIRGDEVEVDKRILEEMKDPLVHILRNCVDHGIESPAERVRAGKPSRATITVAFLPVNGSKVELRVSDDGRGIDPAKVKASAIKHGRLTREEANQLSEAASLDLIFQSDVSTSPIITQLSGRGLGLAIVREKAEKLGGRAFVESRVGRGTEMRIVLPIALATFRGIIVESAGRLFVIPTMQVERAARFRPADVETVEGHETLVLDERATSLVWLADVLELPTSERPAETSTSTPVILLGTGDQRIAFAVDRVRGEQEVLVKQFGKPLSRVRNMAGATVLGSGEVAPIINVQDLLKSARLGGRRSARGKVESAAEPEAKSILVSEDSITSRMLLKGILESAGYRVKTAVDGMEAYTTLRAERFDLLVSDVEMPRLNGFDLTARVRADRKLAELPVILVTALETREDRERGIDAGANAYLVKSNFDQSNLLEAVRRLI